ncbi:unnamed protein product [Umbelopsis vinacea]
MALSKESTAGMTRKPILILSLAFTLRIILFNIPTIANTLATRVEVVTPITSFKQLTEGLYLYENSVPPYDNGIFHQAPFLLVLFSALTSLSPLAIPVGYAAVDTYIGYLLTVITQDKQQVYTKMPKLEVEKGIKSIDPWTVAALYLFNPLTILSCVSKSTLIFTNLSIVLALSLALKDDKLYTMFWVAVASYLSCYPAMLMPPLVLVMYNWTPSDSTLMKQAQISAAYFVAWLAMFLISSRILVGSWDYLYSTYGTIEHPIFVIIVLSGIMSILKSYPSIGDAALCLGLLPVHDELFKYTRYGFLVANLFLYSAALAPIFWHLWIYAGSGNANFFYAITLVYNLGQVLLLIDIVYAMLRRSFDIANPHTLGKEVVHK